MYNYFNCLLLFFTAQFSVPFHCPWNQCYIDLRWCHIRAYSYSSVSCFILVSNSPSVSDHLPALVCFHPLWLSAPPWCSTCLYYSNLPCVFSLLALCLLASSSSPLLQTFQHLTSDSFPYSYGPDLNFCSVPFCILLSYQQISRITSIKTFVFGNLNCLRLCFCV